MHIYAFGSMCRGDVLPGSDVDLLAIVEGQDSRFDPDTFSIYSYDRIRQLWEAGNPFGWHLFFESRLLFGEDGQDFLRSLERPKPYRHYVQDCEKFLSLFRRANESLLAATGNSIFELSTVFLSVRNIATCYSLGVMARPDFSRRSALRLETQSIPISTEVYRLFERARVLSTRGYGQNLKPAETEMAIRALKQIDPWMNALVEESKKHERIQ